MNDASTDALGKAQNSPWVIYALVIFLVVSALAQAVPKVQQILGPLGKLIGRRAEEARRVALEADDRADSMRDLKIAELEAWKKSQEERNRNHYEWDLLAYGALRQAGIEIDAPPPLN